MQSAPQRPLSLGDIVGLAFRRFRQNFALYWRVFIVPALGAAAGCDGASYAFLDWLQIASKSMLAAGPFVGHMALVLVGIIVWALSVWELTLRAGAMMRYNLGLESDFAACYKQVKIHARSSFGAYSLIVFPPLLVLLLWAAVTVGLLTLLPEAQPLRFIVGGLGFGFIGFGLTVSCALVGLFGALTVSAVAVESLTWRQSLARPAYFFQKRMLRGGSFICLITMTLVFLYIACFSPVFVADIVEQYGHVNLGMASHSVLSQFIQTVLDTCFNVVSFGVGFTSYGLFYHDLRLRLEGDDIMRKIQNVA